MREMVRTFLQREIDLQVTPGAVIRVRHKGEIVLDETVGTNSLEDDRVPISNSHLFDMASLTKVMVTLPAILQICETGEIHLHDKVAMFIPSFQKHGKESVTIKQLLTHSSGLTAHRPFFERRLSAVDVLKEIVEEKLEYAPDTDVVYSDLGFILLMEIIEKVTGQKIDEYAKQHLFGPMGMKNTGYKPAIERQRYAPTEYYDHLQDHKYGIVHDDNTEFMGGISCHAGLFSTMEDLSVFTKMLENDGMHEGKKILDPYWLAVSRRNFTPFADESRGLGWQLKGGGASPAGDLMSQGTYGHTGFTGTSFYIDPERELTVMLLTNRVYFGRHLAMLRLRPRLHNIIYTSLF
ncbi:beta-lactamase family protein [Sporosarcina luteola]|uniref:serine hydrolase domain-containing protein n=1 Tax=Sporosarcina luteola TaxID=582850 RepID=UPI00203FB0D0|nr:serine hydrolase domain-containing protein [Sporosarcina luteola]MCM3636736.1 beta-lactamase family protein [Sporosarcina luteola]